MPEYGYGGQILKIDLSSGKIQKQPSKDYTDKYIGGHGVAARLYWEMVPAEAKATDPKNCLIAASGPVAGFAGFAGNRWKLCGKTPLNTPESFNYCNLGERWGSILKFAGYDALAVQGRAEKPVYLYIHDGEVEIKDASHLWGLSTYDAADIVKKETGSGVSVLAVGQAGENLVPFSIVLADGASGSGGMGAVMGSKNLKAIAVAGNKKAQAADPDRLRQFVKIIQDNRPKNDFPTMWGIPGLSRLKPCWGCGIGCYRESYPAEKDRQYKVLCQASNIYEKFPATRTGDTNSLLGTRLCDGYGLDTSVIQGMIEFLDVCHKEGLITEKQTGLPLSRIGSLEFNEKFFRSIALKQGFGEVLAKGIIAAAAEIGRKATDMLHMFVATRGSEKKDYDPRLLMITAMSYATEPRRPIQQLHEISSMCMAWVGMGMSPGAKPGTDFTTADFRKVAKKLWGSEIAADFSTYEGKALAAKKMQDRVFFKESMILCDLRWTMSQAGRVLGTTKDTVSEEQVYTAVTGREIDTAEFARTGERIFNLQRAILLRQGRGGRKGDTILDYFFTEPFKKGELFFNEEGLMPGKDGDVISKIGATVDRNEFEKMKTEYYQLRGWDAATGYPTKAKLNELGLNDVAVDLKERGLVG
jgi:aldehyde:ferredoxin oxidoreductase